MFRKIGLPVLVVVIVLGLIGGAMMELSVDRVNSPSFMTPPTATPQPFKRGWQHVEIASLDYTPKRAAEEACGVDLDNAAYHDSVVLETGPVYDQYGFYVEKEVGVEIEGFYRRVTLRASPLGLLFVNKFQFPGGEIGSAYYAAAVEDAGNWLFYIRVQMRPQPDLERLTTEASVLCAYPGETWD